MNKLLTLIKRRKRIFFVIVLVLILLVVGIRIVECYYKEFLFKQVVMNEYFKAGLVIGFHLFSPSYTVINENEYENFYDYLLTYLSTIYEDLSTMCIEMYYYFIILPFLFVKHYFFDDHKPISIERIKSPFFKKHILYRVSVYPIPILQRERVMHCPIFKYSRVEEYPLLKRWIYVAAVNIDRFKVHKIENDVRCVHDIRLDQKVIKNFNELIIKEKISINSCEDCLEFIKTLFKLIFREHLIESEDLIKYDKDSFKVYCHGHPEGEKKEHRKAAPFIFKPSEADYYYVELYLPAGKYIDFVVYLSFIKNTFKIKKNGIIYDFNEIIFWPISYE